MKPRFAALLRRTGIEKCRGVNPRAETNSIRTPAVFWLPDPFRENNLPLAQFAIATDRSGLIFSRDRSWEGDGDEVPFPSILVVLRLLPVEGVHLLGSRIAEQQRRIVRREGQRTVPSPRSPEVRQVSHSFHFAVAGTNPVNRI